MLLALTASIRVITSDLTNLTGIPYCLCGAIPSAPALMLKVYQHVYQHGIGTNICIHIMRRIDTNVATESWETEWQTGPTDQP